MWAPAAIGWDLSGWRCGPCDPAALTSNPLQCKETGATLIEATSIHIDGSLEATATRRVLVQSPANTFDLPDTTYWKLLGPTPISDIMSGFRLRHLGINLLGARNSAIQNLVAEVPPPLVAELLGYSYQVAHRHAEIAAQPWSQYAT